MSDKIEAKRGQSGAGTSRSEQKRVVICLSEDVVRALLDARAAAMSNTIKAKIPECGDFGAIAQNLDFVCGQLGLDT